MPVKEPCINAQRSRLIRLATYSALRKFLAATGMRLSDGRTPSTKGRSLLLFDIYDHVASINSSATLPVNTSKVLSIDGHHLTSVYTRLAAECLMFTLFGPKKSGHNCHTHPGHAAFFASGFFTEIPKNVALEVDEFDRTPREDIPYEEPQCMCGTSSTSSAHPICRMEGSWCTQYRRYAFVQYYLTKGFRGMTQIQVHELVTIVCEDQSPRETMREFVYNRMRLCLDNMGATQNMSLDPRVPLQPRRNAPMDALCLCVSPTTDTDGRANPRCAEVDRRWKEEVVSGCVFV